MAETAYFAHESCYIDEPCSIGEGTRIWHFSHVMKNSVIGKGCTIGQNVLVSTDVRVGDRCKVQNNVSLYTGVILEDDVFCGPSAVFTNVINPRSEVIRKAEYRQTLVGRGATIGANATIVCGLRLGQYAFIGAGAVVTRDVPDFALMTGNPARQRGFMCRCGLKLEVAAGKARCNTCGTAYLSRGDGLSIVS
jgi:UDP-2-acetamido-3-amino-2,3-dideoxy-glucuronate N-acetyltransferase